MCVLCKTVLSVCFSNCVIILQHLAHRTTTKRRRCKTRVCFVGPAWRLVKLGSFWVTCQPWFKHNKAPHPFQDVQNSYSVGGCVTVGTSSIYFKTVQGKTAEALSMDSKMLLCAKGSQKGMHRCHRKEVKRWSVFPLCAPMCALRLPCLSCFGNFISF